MNPAMRSFKEIAGKLGAGIKSVETYKARGSDKVGLRPARTLFALHRRRAGLKDFDRLHKPHCVC